MTILGAMPTVSALEIQALRYELGEPGVISTGIVVERNAALTVTIGGVVNVTVQGTVLDMTAAEPVIIT